MPSIFERWRLFSRPAVYLLSAGGDASSSVLNLTAKELYQTQDNLRAVVDFLSNSIAQLPLKVYVRDGENERNRDRDSVAAKLLRRPNADQTEFEFIRALVIEYFVFGNVYVWVLPDAESESGYQLRIVPNDWIVNTEVKTSYAPDTIRICTKNGGTAVDVPRDEFIQFRTYSAGNPGGYLSPISALKQTLSEQVESGKFRRQLWRSSGRLNAQITRPKDVQPWTDEQRKNFATMFRESWKGDGSKAGAIPIMEDGMEIKPFSASFKEYEWAQSVKLSRESVAAAYGVNPSLIWHSETQTYASSKDNARALYAECLGPVIQMLQQRINSFLLPKIGAEPNTYVIFDLNEKLKGSFEERASILQSAVGGPWLTRDEARADMDLPPLPDGQGAELIVPMNVTVGGQASPTDTQPDAYDYPAPVGRPSEDNSPKMRKACDCPSCKAPEIHIKGKSTDEEDTSVSEVIKEFLKRQRRSVISRIGAGSENWFDSERWNRELAEDMLPALTSIADVHGADAAEALEWTYDTDITRAYLEAAAQGRASRINAQTQRRLELAMEDSEDPDFEEVFDKREEYAEVLGRSAATEISSWAVREAAHQAESDGAPSVARRVVLKEWVTGLNPRPSHAAMNGERVPIDADFSNGQHWPGEDNGDPDESCGCNCSTEVIIQ